MAMDRKIYLRQEEIKVGCGSTSRATTVENYYQVTEVDDTHVDIQLLDFSDRPLGNPSVIDKGKLKDYIYCPDYFKNKKGSKELSVEKHVHSGDKHLEKKEFLSAEYEYDRALSADENHLRANLGKGKTLFATGRKAEAQKVFQKISSLDALFEVENKHIFNEFGIELRKKGMLEEAISNYLKALSIDPRDEILYYNLGRVYYEQGKLKDASSQLEQALKVKPGFKRAEEFLSRIQTK